MRAREDKLSIRDLRELADEKRAAIISQLADWYKDEWGKYYDPEKDWKKDVMDGIGSSESKLPFRLALLKGDELIGTISVKAEDKDVYLFDLGVVGPWLSRFYIHKDFQGQGFGAMLTAALSARLYKLRYKDLYVFHSPKLNSFYEKLSFETPLVIDAPFNVGGVNTSISIQSGKISKIVSTALLKWLDKKTFINAHTDETAEAKMSESQTAFFNHKTMLAICFEEQSLTEKI